MSTNHREVGGGGGGKTRVIFTARATFPQRISNTRCFHSARFKAPVQSAQRAVFICVHHYLVLTRAAVLCEEQSVRV